jgi:hypothetical protein
VFVNVAGAAKGNVARSFATKVVGNGSADGGFEKDRIHKKAGDPTRREFTYFMLGGGRFMYATIARLVLIKVGLTPAFDIFVHFTQIF